MGFPVKPCTDPLLSSLLQTMNKSPRCGVQMKKHHIHVTHYLYDQNEQDSYKKHRCYMFEGQCVCECTDAPEYADHDGNLVNRFGNGTIQGAAAGIKLGDFKDQPDSYSTWNEHKTRNFTFGHLGSIKHQQIFKKSDKFWKPPSYYIGKAEIEAIRSCCSRNDIIHTADPGFPNCAELA